MAKKSSPRRNKNNNNEDKNKDPLEEKGNSIASSLSPTADHDDHVDDGDTRSNLTDSSSMFETFDVAVVIDGDTVVPRETIRDTDGTEQEEKVPFDDEVESGHSTMPTTLQDVPIIDYSTTSHGGTDNESLPKSRNHDMATRNGRSLEAHENDSEQQHSQPKATSKPSAKQNFNNSLAMETTLIEILVTVVQLPMPVVEMLARAGVSEAEDLLGLSKQELDHIIASSSTNRQVYYCPDSPMENKSTIAVVEVPPLTTPQLVAQSRLRAFIHWLDQQVAEKNGSRYHWNISGEVEGVDLTAFTIEIRKHIARDLARKSWGLPRRPRPVPLRISPIAPPPQSASADAGANRQLPQPSVAPITNLSVPTTRPTAPQATARTSLRFNSDGTVRLRWRIGQAVVVILLVAIAVVTTLLIVDVLDKENDVNPFVKPSTSTNDTRDPTNDTTAQWHIPGEWVQVKGYHFRGQNDWERYGAAVDVSADGSTIVVGAPGRKDYDMTGRVYTYVYDNSIGRYRRLEDSPIESAVVGSPRSMERFGAAIAVSGDGRVMAGGAPFNDTLGYWSGIVRTYNAPSDLTGLPEPYGQELFGERDPWTPFDQFGVSLDLNANGTIIAIGASEEGDPLEGGVTGYCVVFKMNEATSRWEQLGQFLKGREENSHFGISLSLDAEGTTLAVGEPKAGSGSMQIFSLVNSDPRKEDQTSFHWKQIALFSHNEDVGNDFGRVVRLSSNGRVAACAILDEGREGVHLVEVYGLDERNTWVKRGQTLKNDGALQDLFGFALALSADGNALVIGAPYDNQHPLAGGSVYVFQYDSIWDTWVRRGEKILGMPRVEMGSSVAVSDSGTVVIGAPGYETDTGIVEVYRFVRDIR